jgi:hypothetical protein
MVSKEKAMSFRRSPESDIVSDENAGRLGQILSLAYPMKAQRSGDK